MFRLAWLPVALLIVGCDEPAGETRREQQSIDLAGAQSARVNLAMGAGELMVGSGASTLVEAEFTYNLDRLKPTVEHHTSGGETDVAISQTETGSFNFGNVVSRWDLRLNNGVPLDVIAKLGAGEAHMNLGDLTLRRLDVGIGAGEVHVRSARNAEAQLRRRDQGRCRRDRRLPAAHSRDLRNRCRRHRVDHHERP